MDKLYINTANINVTITFLDTAGSVIDLTGFNTPTYTIRYRKPSGAVGSLAASTSGQPAGTIIASVASVLDEIGVWEFQGKVVEGGGSQRTIWSDTVEFYVARSTQSDYVPTTPGGVQLADPWTPTRAAAGALGDNDQIGVHQSGAAKVTVLSTLATYVISKMTADNDPLFLIPTNQVVIPNTSNVAATTINSTNFGSLALANNEVFVCLIRLDQAFTPAEWVYRMGAVTGSGTRDWAFGLYDLAGNRLLNSSMQGMSAGNGAYRHSFTPATIRPGAYYLAMAKSFTGSMATTVYGISMATFVEDMLSAMNIPSIAKAANPYNAGMPATLGALTTLEGNAYPFPFTVWLTTGH